MQADEFKDQMIEQLTFALKESERLLAQYTKAGSEHEAAIRRQVEAVQAKEAADGRVESMESDFRVEQNLLFQQDRREKTQNPRSVLTASSAEEREHQFEAYLSAMLKGSADSLYATAVAERNRAAAELVNSKMMLDITRERRDTSRIALDALHSRTEAAARLAVSVLGYESAKLNAQTAIEIQLSAQTAAEQQRAGLKGGDAAQTTPK